MKQSQFNRATHFSIIWGVTLAVMTLLEWNNLDREPMKPQILSPFIERNISVSVEAGSVEESAARTNDLPELFEPENTPDGSLRYEVDFGFNGPLFLACFFGPVAFFHAVRLLWNRRRENG